MLEYAERQRKLLQISIPSYFLSYENHRNYNEAHQCLTMTELEMFCKKENLIFKGLAIPPYNPYGEEYNYAVVFEDIENDYRLIWHHCSRTWIKRIESSLKQ